MKTVAPTAIPTPPVGEPPKKNKPTAPEQELGTMKTVHESEVTQTVEERPKSHKSVQEKYLEKNLRRQRSLYMSVDEKAAKKLEEEKKRGPKKKKKESVHAKPTAIDANATAANSEDIKVSESTGFLCGNYTRKVRKKNCIFLYFEY